MPRAAWTRSRDPAAVSLRQGTSVAASPPDRTPSNRVASLLRGHASSASPSQAVGARSVHACRGSETGGNLIEEHPTSFIEKHGAIVIPTIVFAILILAGVLFALTAD